MVGHLGRCIPSTHHPSRQQSSLFYHTWLIVNAVILNHLYFFYKAPNTVWYRKLILKQLEWDLMCIQTLIQSFCHLFCRRCRTMIHLEADFFLSGFILDTRRSPQLSWTLLHLTLLLRVEERSVFKQRGVCFTTCQRLWESLSSEAEESQKRSRVGRLAAGICGAVSLHPVHAGPTCYRELPPWHEQAPTAVRSVLLPDRRRRGFWGPCHLTWRTSSSTRRRFGSHIRSSRRESGPKRKVFSIIYWMATD